MQYHPDRNKAPDASERMKEINEARRLLARSAEIRAGRECPQCNGWKTVRGSSAQAGAGSERNRQEHERNSRADTSGDRSSEARRDSGDTASGSTDNGDAGKRSSGGRGWCWFILSLLLIAGIAGGVYYFWLTSQEAEGQPASTPTPTARAVAGATPTPTPIPVAATATLTPFPCADPTPIPTPTATPDPSATPTPTPIPLPLTDAWHEWMRDWSAREVNTALAEIIRDFDRAVESLEGIPLREGCPLVDDLETRLAAAGDIARVHRLEDVIVAGQHGGHTWKIWLLNRREVLAATVTAHVPLAECRSVLAVPTPMPMPTATVMPHGTPLPPCPTATPTPPPTATPTTTATATPTATPQPRTTATPTPRPRPTATSTPRPQAIRVHESVWECFADRPNRRVTGLIYVCTPGLHAHERGASPVSS